MNKSNEQLFVVGPVVPADIFLGREDLIAERIETVFKGTAAINMVGSTRIGKSSIINYAFEQHRNTPGLICVEIDMSGSKNAFSFWKTLSNLIKDSIKKTDIWDKTFEMDFSEVKDAINSAYEDWFTDYLYYFKNVLIHMGEKGYRLVLAIDEFDAVERLFGDQAHYYQAIREIHSKPRYATSGVLVSRRRLHLFEAKCPYISTFHGVFEEVPIPPFDQKDMGAFYEAIACCDIELTREGKERLNHFTGNSPYLCCMFAERMASQQVKCHTYGAKEIEAIFRELRPQITRHYDDLIERLREDRHLETVFYLSIGARPPYVTDETLEDMRMMGILQYDEDKDTSKKYYAFCHQFMIYLRTIPLQLPAWDIMTESEKKIKSIFKKQYPLLASIGYQELIGPREAEYTNQVETAYPELRLNWNIIRRYAEDLSLHKDNPTILDVLTLAFVIDVILSQWTSTFHRYFQGDANWIYKLEQIKKLRNPMAHAMQDFIDRDELAIGLKYCEEIIRMKY